MGLTKELKGILVGAGLVLAGEIQVDIWDLVAAEPQEGLERDVEAVLDIFCPANGTDSVRHVHSAAIEVSGILGIIKVRMLALGAAVVGWQGVDLGNTGHEGDQRGAHRSP